MRNVKPAKESVKCLEKKSHEDDQSKVAMHPNPQMSCSMRHLCPKFVPDHYTVISSHRISSQAKSHHGYHAKRCKKKSHSIIHVRHIQQLQLGPHHALKLDPRHARRLG